MQVQLTPFGSGARLWIGVLAIALLSGCASDQGSTPRTGANTGGGIDKGRMSDLAARSLEHGQYGAAAQFYRKAAEAQPNTSKPRIGLARALMAMNKPREAVKAYREALDREPASVSARVGLGRALTAADRPAAAVTALDKLIRRDDIGYEPYLARGVALDLLGRHDDAQESYRAGLTVDPGALALRNNLGLSRLLGGDTAAGLAILRKAAQSPAAKAKTRQNLALAYGLAGRMDKAAEIARRDLGRDGVRRNLDYYETLHAIWTQKPGSRPEGHGDDPKAEEGVKDEPTAEQPRQVSGASTTALALPKGTPASTPPRPGNKPARPDPLQAMLDQANGEPLRLAAALALSDRQGGTASVRIGAEAGASAQESARLDDLIAMARQVLSSRLDADAAQVAESHWLQLASLGSRARAKREKARLSANFPKLTRAFPLSLHEGSTDSTNRVHRLRAGPFESARAPTRLCRALRERGQGCLVVRQ